jgi:hypothetical protein
MRQVREGGDDVSNKVILMVLAAGQDVIAELVSEEPTHFVVKEPRLVGFDPQNKQIHYVDFLPHATREAKEAAPIVKNNLLTWYEPKERLAKNYIEAKTIQNAKDAGIVLPNGGNAPKIQVP